ncbi:MAG: ATP-binding protein [Deltaproteobacteria bacterium]|nr:ATP-binding protein [Deltaproteobacteria bacterium]
MEINWDNFAAKFSANKQGAFERLCYLLFCKEYGRNTGIFRFKNHAGIETNPIEKDGRVIGWQAKFYDTRLSEHKDDFIQSINTTKTRHPTVNKIIFYTNQEFGQDKKKTDPQYKTDIENHAKGKGIYIEWRTASYFESPFVCEQNFSIAQHFFSLKKGILDSITGLSLHTESVLKPIRSEILYNGKKIKLDRSAVAASLKDATSNSCPIILSGGAGVGKTAVIKDFYQEIKKSWPLFVFKAIQFKNISHVNQLFENYGEITATDFINEHKDIEQKYVVFDSAEKLSEIEDHDVFRMLLFNLLENGWTVIFTVRYSYLDDLRFQLKEVYGVGFTSLNVPNLTIEEIEKIAGDYNFKLPENERLINLLVTPFYLNEYLQNYASIVEDISYTDFCEIIWKKQIQDSSRQLGNIHRRREECFLKIAQKRANDGDFCVKIGDCDPEALQKLEADEIIKYDSNARGYFIIHDVHEEWALDKIIEQAFISAQDYGSFYQEIGNSLPVRRVFRNWLSDKLFRDDENAKQLIQFTVKDNRIDSYWKDEVLVSVLLSNYSSVFFERFEDDLLGEFQKVVSHGRSSKIVRTSTISYKYEDRLLHKILFFLRIACKTIDEDFLHLLGVRKAEAISLKTIFTVPKGSGWDSTIAFINKHKGKLRFRYMSVILPVLDDWNRSHKQGETTKNASQIALFYYEELTKQDGFYFSSSDDTKDKLIRTILNGSGEIKAELTNIANEVVAQKDTSHRGRYYELVKVILSSITDSSEISKHLPEEVIKLANLFWFYTPRETHYPFSDYRNDIEQYFDLSEGLLEYYPASAFQTPIFQLLQTDSQKTVDFILSSTNKSIEYFAKSELAQNEAEEIDVVVDDSGTTIKQYICHRIWNMYRGTQVAPPLLESIHMALERWLLIAAKTTTPEIIENWCLYLLKNSRSASITAIVASVVLAEPSKLFNVAKVLFRTKDLFFFDTARMQLDMTAKSTYAISYDPMGIFKNERLQTCDDKHRSSSLENLALHYQVFTTEGEGEEVVKHRQEVIWKIFDDYYKQLPEKSKETESDKTWRLYLARMDRRKMKIATEKKNDQVLISFNPEIDPELKEYSEDSLAKSSESMKYLPLQLWARNKFERNEDYKKYPQYENDYKLAILDTKKIIEGLKDDKSEDKSFTLFYHSVPAYVCGVLIRDWLEKLDAEERKLCKDVIMERAAAPLSGGYRYQVGDGVGAAISVLPLLLKLFPDDADEIIKILFFILFDSYPIGMNQRLSDYSVGAILNALWKESPADANSIFLGFLQLKPKYDELRESSRKENYKRGVYNISKRELLETFSKKHEAEITKVIANEIDYSEIANVDQIDTDTLVTAFRLLPMETSDKVHKKFMRQIFPAFSKKLFKDRHERGKEDRFDYTRKRRFLEKLAYVILSSRVEDIEAYLKPFLDGFKDSKDAVEFFSEFINAEDRLAQYEQFWTIWRLFYPKVAALAQGKGSRFYSKEIIRNYLLAWDYWREGAREWHSLKDREKSFFKKASEDMGGHPTVLYSISKLLNDIGSGFRDDGVFWISDIIKNNPGLTTEELEVNTIYYLENLVRGYILKNRHKIKITRQLKSQILIILNFLLSKGSVTAYLLREDIL